VPASPPAAAGGSLAAASIGVGACAVMPGPVAPAAAAAATP
jgi:hypothetical protein